MRKLFFAFTLLFGMAAFAQKSLIITHDDPIKAPDTISTYAVQPDGSLLLIGSFATGTNGGGGSGGAGISFIPTRKIAISGDNKFVYASAAPVNSVSAFSIDGNTGLLTLVPGSPFKTGANACEGMGLAASPNGKTLYAFSACPFTFDANGLPVPTNSTLSSFAIGPDGSLTTIGAGQVVHLPLDMTVSGDGKFLVLSTGNSNGQAPETTIFNINADGSLSPVPGSPFPAATTSQTIFTLTANIDCSNHLFHGLDDLTNGSSMEVFNIAAGGILKPIAGSPFLAIPAAPDADGMVGAALAQNGKVLVVADEAGFAMSLSVAADGTLTPVSGRVGDPAEGLIGQMTADSSGAFVYTRGFENNTTSAIRGFSVDPNANLAVLQGSPFPSGNLTPFGTMASYPVKACTPAPTVVSFGAFNVELKEFTAAPRSFELEGSFTLGAASNGIAPLTEAVTVKAGTYSATIPAGSFNLSSTGSFNFAGTIGGVKVEMSIIPSTTIKNKYSFEFEAPVDLSGAGSPVAVSLSIGDDTGSASVKPEIRTSK